MKKLNKGQIVERDLIAEALAEKALAVEAACNVLDVALSHINETIAAYNAELANAREWRDGIVEAAEEWREGRSEKWLESDAASEHESWVSEYRDAELDDLDEIEAPDYPQIEAVLGTLSEASE